MEFGAALSQIREWLSELYSAAQVDRAVVVQRHKRTIRFKLWTATNEYSVVADLNGPQGYLGAFAKSRMSRAGETWHRGNDLPDGNFCEETWRKILEGIVRYEAQEIKSDKWKEEYGEPTM